MISKQELGKFHRRLHGWFRKNGRDLPWRRNRDPYAVLVSEFMLQQTTVAAVIPYYDRWMKSFPDVSALAAAEEEAVLRHWEGLGYYSRARNLLRAARAIVADHGGVVPSRIAELLRLPGIGPYTASAIVAFSFDRPVPVLDANIIRVVARLFHFRRPVDTAKGRQFLEQSAKSLLPKNGGYLHASSLMELGATVCKSGKPDCPVCPVKMFCKAVGPETIPLKAPRKMVIHERDPRILAMRNGEVCLVPSSGPRWKGLWLLPVSKGEGRTILKFPYIVTRHRITMEISRARARADWQSFAPAHLPPMPTPHRRVLAMLLKEC